MPFLSPTINCFFSAEHYLKFIEDMPRYLSLPLKDITGNGAYPIAALGDIVIHFLHYTSFEEASVKWRARKNRVDWDHLVYIMVDQNGCTPAHLERFMSIDGRKVFLTARKDFLSVSCDKSCEIVYMESEFYAQKHNGRTLVDDAFAFDGLSGKRRYEKFFDLETLLDSL